VGHDHRSGEIRTFAVERIQNLELTEQGFQVPASFDFDSWSASSFGVIAEPATRVVLRFERRWASYVEEHTWHPSQKLRPRRGGQLELTMEVGDTADLRAWILSFGAGAEVIEPPELRQALAQELRDASARYSEGPEQRSKPASGPAKGARGSARA
jgi:predicted DNA-binding transcriptional regulator YafY